MLQQHVCGLPRTKSRPRLSLVLQSRLNSYIFVLQVRESTCSDKDIFLQCKLFVANLKKFFLSFQHPTDLSDNIDMDGLMNFFPDRVVLNLTMSISHSHLGYIFQYISTPR